MSIIRKCLIIGASVGALWTFGLLFVATLPEGGELTSLGLLRLYLWALTKAPTYRICKIFGIRWDVYSIHDMSLIHMVAVILINCLLLALMGTVIVLFLNEYKKSKK